MKERLLLLIFAMSLAFAPAAVAKVGSEPGYDRQPGAIGTDNDRQGEQPATEQLHVRNPQGEDLGVIVSFLVDPDIEKVAYALVDTGNSLAEKDLRLVPVHALMVEDGAIILNMDKQQLANAPIPAPGQEPMDFHRRAAEYYGVAPYWEEE